MPAPLRVADRLGSDGSSQEPLRLELLNQDGPKDCEELSIPFNEKLGRDSALGYRFWPLSCQTSRVLFPDHFGWSGWPFRRD